MAQALRILAGATARRHLLQQGLQPSDVGVIPGAAGGPKGLILAPLDRFVFGEWLTQSTQPIDLIGASVGAWRLSTVCMPDPIPALHDWVEGYIGQRYDVPAGRRRPSAAEVTDRFRSQLEQAFPAAAVHALLRHPRWRLHLVTARGRHVLSRDGAWRTPLGYAAAYACNALSRPALGRWLQRVVFSASEDPWPFDADGFSTHRVPLTPENFLPALQASCSIPFALQPVAAIPGAPAGAYWDGGITDYHLHLPYRPAQGLVLYPHFHSVVIPGWLDKPWRWRHRATAALDRVVLLAPHPDWVATLPNGKLPDRSDFVRYAHDPLTRMRIWRQAVSASQQLADEWAEWLRRPDPRRVEAWV